MPDLGAIKLGRDIGFKCSLTQSYVWHSCIGCGKERWVQLRKGNPTRLRCTKCGTHGAESRAKARATAIKRGTYTVHAKPNGTVDAPVIGDIRRGIEIGIGSGAHHVYVWHSCVTCGLSRWVRMRNGQPTALRCPKCALADEGIRARMSATRTGKKIGHRTKSWKGRREPVGGYVGVWVAPTDFFSPMRDGRGFVMEHRLVMAMHLGRCLTRLEVVHHKNGIKHDNRIENLELSNPHAHIKDHNLGYQDGYKKGWADARSQKVRELQARIQALEQRTTILEGELALAKGSEASALPPGNDPDVFRGVDDL